MGGMRSVSVPLEGPVIARRSTVSAIPAPLWVKVPPASETRHQWPLFATLW